MAAKKQKGCQIEHYSVNFQAGSSRLYMVVHNTPPQFLFAKNKMAAKNLIGHNSGSFQAISSRFSMVVKSPKFCMEVH